MLRSIGIQPDAIVCRSDRELPDSIKSKIALMSDVDPAAVVNAADAKSIYDIPVVIHDEGLDSYIINKLELEAGDVDWSHWQPVLNAVHNPAHEVNVALVGKYVDLPDAYLSVTEAIRAGGFANRAKVNIHWIASDDCETLDGAKEKLSSMDAICIPGGFGIRGIEGKLGAIRYAREQQIPTLGLCLGLQCMVIEYARNVAGLENASSTEFDPETPNPVIATMAEQVDVLADGDMGGTMRLGMFEAKLEPGSLVSEVYGSEKVSERHRHRYEVNNSFRGQIADAGLVFSGTSPDGHLVEFVELNRDEHPYFVATQAHPEFRSRPDRAHPLFAGLIKAGLARQQEQLLFEVKD
jgi:CTP synthase